MYEHKFWIGRYFYTWEQVLGRWKTETAAAEHAAVNNVFIDLKTKQMYMYEYVYWRLKQCYILNQIDMFNISVDVISAVHDLVLDFY